MPDTYNNDLMVAELERDESTVLYAYTDSLGYLTIGTGHLIDHRKGGSIPQHISDLLLQYDIDQKAAELDTKMVWWRNLDSVRQRVILNMAFNLGVDGLLGFPHFLAAMQAENWQEASAQMEDSHWYTQVGDRAKRLQQMVLTGEAQ